VGEPIVALLAEEWQAIAALGSELRPEEWDMASECPGWTVRDLVSHMVGTERSLLGEPTPPHPGPAPHVHNPTAAANEAWVAPRRSRPGPEVLAEFRDISARRLEQLAAMTADRFDVPGPSPIGIVPYREFLAVRVMDCWVHEQDMRVATGRPSRCDGPAAALALDRLASAMGYVLSKKAAAPEGSSVRVNLSDAPARRIEVAVRNGRGVTENVTGPTATIEMDTELFWRLTCGRADGDAAVSSGLLRTDGDADLAAAVVRNMAIMI
jgi:uncharacterized protein (TIGR03083 family)